MEPHWMVIAGVILHFLLQGALIVQAILRPHRDPSSRVAWIVVLVTMPVIGIIAYILLGSVSIGRLRIARVERILNGMPQPKDIPGMSVKEIQPLGNSRFDHVFRVGYSINGFEPIGGNTADLMTDSCAAIDSMIRDIDVAKKSCARELLYLADRQQRHQDGPSDLQGRSARSDMPCDGRWSGISRHHSF